MVLWAHNWHIGTWGELSFESGEMFPFTWMGIDLRQRYHDHYLTIGFSFFEGAHNAILMDQEDNVIRPGRQAYTLVEARQESYHHTLTRAGKLYLLDVRSVPTGEVSAWLDGPHPFRDFGAEHVDEGGYTKLSLSKRFDVLVHIEKISPTQLLPKA
jgi:erythromycin esterase